MSQEEVEMDENGMCMESGAKIILTMSDQGGSVLFTDRLLVMNKGGTEKVSRTTKEDKPASYNAVFDCKVLSKTQAEFGLTEEGEFVLADSGSTNGSFVNNFRLSKPGQPSKVTRIYSGDTVRFGSQVYDKNKKVKENCVICEIKILLHNGLEYQGRPVNDRLHKKPGEKRSKVKLREVSFDSKLRQLRSEKEEKLEKDGKTNEETIVFLEKKLKRKQNEVENLFENVNNIKERELSLAAQVGELTAKLEIKSWELDELGERLQLKNQESLKLSDKLAVAVKDQMENVRAMDLQMELEESRQQLKKTTEEVWVLKERLRVEKEAGQKREERLEALRDELEVEQTKEGTVKNDKKCPDLENELKSCQKEIESNKIDIKHLNDLVSKADEIVKEKEKDILWLNQLVDKEERMIKEKDGDYLSLKCLMTEENETVHQIESEMKRLLTIIQEDQVTMLNKDKLIIGLQKALKEKEGSHESPNSRQDMQRMVGAKDREISEVREDLQAIIDENECKMLEMKVDVEEQKKLSLAKEQEIKEMKENVEKSENLKTKIDDLNKIIEQKNCEIDNLQKSLESHEASLESTLDSLQKEIIVHKMASQQKDSDIKTLKENIEHKEDIIKNISDTCEANIKELTHLKTQITIKENELIRLKETVEMKETHISDLEQKIVNEQEMTKETEEEFIQLRIEVDNLRLETQKMRLVETPDRLQDLSEVDQVKLLKLRDQEIEHLKVEIETEQQIVAHVQITQEKEIIEKEREISVLQSVLAQEKQSLLEKDKEIGLLKESYLRENGLNIPLLAPVRPKRTKYIDNQEEPVMEAASEDVSETITFHDALSDEEDVLIEDLELDKDEEDDVMLRRSDIGDIDIEDMEDDLSLG